MGTSSSYRTVFFDLDGTLIDHFQAIYRCYCFAQEQLGVPKVSYQQVRSTVGGSVPVTMARLLGEELAGEGTRLFREHFDRIMLEDLHLLPGAEWILRELHRGGLDLAVFTNKRGEPSRQILRHLGLDGYLKAIIGTMDTPWKKPEAEFTRYALEQMRAEPESSLMVGDSPFDVAAARAGGLDAMVVATGSHTREDLLVSDPRPDRIFRDLWELGEEVFGLTPADFLSDPPEVVAGDGEGNGGGH